MQKREAGSGVHEHHERTCCIVAHGVTPMPLRSGRSTLRHTVLHLRVPTSKPRVGVTLDPQVYEELKVIAQAENRSLSNLIESWILAELAKRKRQ